MIKYVIIFQDCTHYSNTKHKPFISYIKNEDKVILKRFKMQLLFEYGNYY